MEGAKLKDELQHLRKAVADCTDFEGTGLKGGAPAKEFMGERRDHPPLSYNVSDF